MELQPQPLGKHRPGDRIGQDPRLHLRRGRRPDEFGKGQPPADRLGWLGEKQRYSTGGDLGLVRMGVRLYDPAIGRILQVDPVEGGSANDYEYVFADPCNKLDIEGRLACQKWAKTATGILGYGFLERAAYQGPFGSAEGSPR